MRYLWLPAPAAENQLLLGQKQQNSFAQIVAKSRLNVTVNAANSVDHTNALNAVLQDHKVIKVKMKWAAL